MCSRHFPKFTLASLHTTPFTVKSTSMPILNSKFVSRWRRTSRTASVWQLMLATFLIAPLACELAAADLPIQVSQFVGKHCTACHAGAEAEAGLDLTKLSKDLERLDDPARFVVWVKVHDRVQAGEMPPK